ncbi:MAG: hypothetical protein U0640_11700 [Phycisphaerales bacterium]
MNENPQPAKRFESFWRFLASLEAGTFWWALLYVWVVLTCVMMALSLGMMVAACQSEVARIAASREAASSKTQTIPQHK